MINKQKKKIIQIIQKNPSPSDREGFVYGFLSPHDRNLRNNFWMKLGRTEKENPEERVQEWRGTMVFCQKCLYNRRFERLVHLFFAFANERRIFHKNNIVDTNIDKKENKNEKIKKEIEWFHFMERINICKYISIIQELIENLYNCSINEISENDQINGKERKYKEETNTIKNILSNQDNDNKKEKNEIITKININAAREPDLEEISGIGKKLAKNIVQYRKNNGLFIDIYDIKKVYGFGNKRFENIKDFIVIK